MNKQKKSTKKPNKHSPKQTKKETNEKPNPQSTKLKRNKEILIPEVKHTHAHIHTNPPCISPLFLAQRGKKGDSTHGILPSFFLWLVLARRLNGQFLHSIGREVNHRPGVFMVL